MSSKIAAQSLSWIYIGDRADAKDLAKLKANRIKYILNVTPSQSLGGVPNFHFRNPDFIYCRIPVYDNPSEKLASYYEDAWSFFEKARIRKDGNILVHCNQGVSRSVSMVIAYIIKYYKMSYHETLDLIRKSRPLSKPNDSFIQQLIDLEQTTAKEDIYRDNNLTDKITSSPTPSSTITKKSFSSEPNNKTSGNYLIGPALPPWLSQRSNEPELNNNIIKRQKLSKPNTESLAETRIEVIKQNLEKSKEIDTKGLLQKEIQQPVLQDTKPSSD